MSAIILLFLTGLVTQVQAESIPDYGRASDPLLSSDPTSLYLMEQLMILKHELNDVKITHQAELNLLSREHETMRNELMTEHETIRNELITAQLRITSLENIDCNCKDDNESKISQYSETNADRMNRMARGEVTPTADTESIETQRGIRKDEADLHHRPNQIHKYEGVRDSHTKKLQNSDASTGVVAFYARIGGFTGSPTEKTPIPFDIVDLNLGGAYDPSSGQFTAPVAGIYSLSYEVLPDGTCGTNDICVYMFINGVTVSASCSEVFASGGAAVTVQLASGDTAWVSVDQGQPCLMLHDYHPFNKYSGHLLYQII